MITANLDSITNVSIDSYTNDNQPRYLCDIMIDFDGFNEWSTYCADPNDSSGMGRRIYEAIQERVDSGVIAPTLKEVEE